MYALDPKEARRADQTGNRISEIGKYIGKFTQAEAVTARTGTKGIGMRFEADGQTCNLALYTIKSDGTKLPGNSTVMAILTCLKLRSIEPAPGRVARWDSEQHKDVMENAQVFPALAGFPIGLLLETEAYLKQDGTEGNRMVIAGVFQADTELTASEILDKKTQPLLLAKMVASMRHRPMRPAAAVRPTAERQPTGGAASHSFGAMDDDIPFVTSSMHYDMTTRKQRRRQRAS